MISGKTSSMKKMRKRESPDNPISRDLKLQHDAQLRETRKRRAAKRFAQRKDKK